ncbi:MAG: inositol-3-phosphate synthase [Nitrososphaerota archaeon]
MSRKIRVAIIGVGNCASALIQGVHYYRNIDEKENIPGLMHVKLGDYHIGDIEFVAAFDIDKNKVGKDLSEAIFTPPNNTYKITDVPKLGVTVRPGIVYDSLGKYLSQIIEETNMKYEEISDILKEEKAEIVVNYLPVGSEKATEYYVNQALEAKCAFVNCIPVFIASNPKWQEIFKNKGVPIIGDDIKSQVGATIVHRVLTKLLLDRGVKILRTMQLNIGGDMDFYNMLERERLISKKISKTQAITSLLNYDIGEKNIHIGPSDYVAWLENRKWAYIRLEGEAFGRVPLNIELKLEVWDAYNSAGIVVDAIRCAKIGLDRGLAGPLIGPSAYFMKSPPIQYPDDIARKLVEEFISGKD